jgi:UDP-glucose 4-epimerase
VNRKKVLITGGAGFIGSHVADLLVAQDYDVAVVDNLSSGSRKNLNPRAEFFELDIRSSEMPELLGRLKPEAICHLAAQVSVRLSVEDPEADASINILGSLKLLEAAVKTGVKKVIFSSTGGAIYGEQDYFPADEKHPTRPVSPYGVAKLATEKYLNYYKQEYGLDFVALRYANVYGPRQDPHGEAGVVAIFSQKLLSGGQAIINGDGTQTRDFVFVEDVARSNLLAMESTYCGEINIGTAVETDINNLFRLLKNISGSGVEEFHGPAKPGEQKRSVIDCSRARKILNWEPSVPLEKGLTQTVHYFKQR